MQDLVFLILIAVLAAAVAGMVAGFDALGARK